jgi:tetratricopeptide (TPR) repeat protein
MVGLSMVLAVKVMCDIAYRRLRIAQFATDRTNSRCTLGAVALSTALVLAITFPALAQIDSKNVDSCNGDNKATPRQSIAGCTAMIESDEYTGDQLAIVFSSRGIAYFKNGESEKAIRDYDQAIGLRSNFIGAMIGRGFANLKTTKYDAAIADFDAALKAYPGNAPSLYGRGLANLGKGDAASATADITAAERLDSTVTQELAAWGVNLESPTELAPLSPSAAPEKTGAPKESPTPSTAAEETASLPPAAAPVPPSAQTEVIPSAPVQKIESKPLPAEVIKALVKRGDQLLSRGDIVAARLVYERAAAGGDRAATTGVAKTYDPAFLTQAGARGLRADPAQAAHWYAKAAAAGDREAEDRLRWLRDQFPTVTGSSPGADNHAPP